MRKTRIALRRRGPAPGGEVTASAARLGLWVSFYLRPQRRRAQWWLPPTTKLLSTTRCRPPVGAPRHGQMQMRDRLPFAVRSRLHRLRRSMGLCCTTLPTRRYIACMAYIAYKAYIAYIAHQVGAPVAARLPAPAAPPHPGLTLAPALNPRRLLLPSAGLTLAPSLNPSQLLLTSAAGVPVQDRHDQCTGRRTRGQAGGLRD